MASLPRQNALGGLSLAAIGAVFTIGYAAHLFGEDGAPAFTRVVAAGIRRTGCSSSGN
jgi:hypothetical protein